MKLLQKAKYFTYGIVVTAALVPLAIKAVETIPLTFNEGDVISASVINALLQRIENATSTFTSDDLVGSWNLTQAMPFNGQPGNGSCRSSNTCNVTGTTDSADGLSRYRTDTVTITKSGSIYSYSQTTVSSFVNAHTNNPDSGTLSVIAETVIFKNASSSFSYYYAKKKSADKIVLQDIQSGANAFNMVILDRRNIPPLPANSLTATVSGTSVTLAWNDQSNDETGFKVQRKTSAIGSWTTLTTAATNAVSYTDISLTSGTYWFRVLATNANGDAMSSSEVQAVIQ